MRKRKNLFQKKHRPKYSAGDFFKKVQTLSIKHIFKRANIIFEVKLMPISPIFEK